MIGSGYQCQRCWGTFTGGQGPGEDPEPDLKCPLCGSAEVKKVELPEEWDHLVRGGLCFG